MERKTTERPGVLTNSKLQHSSSALRPSAFTLIEPSDRSPIPSGVEGLRTRPIDRLRARFAFTLIELLVVVAIIMLLAAILLPALKNAQAAAKKAVCASNLRQLHIGVMSYVSTHNDYLMPANIWCEYLWHGDFAGLYGKGPLPNPHLWVADPKLLSVFQCPTNPYRISAWWYSNYAYNFGLSYLDTFTPANTHWTKITRFPNPGIVVLLSDAKIRDPWPTNPNGPVFTTHYATYSPAHGVGFDWHSGRVANFGFIDGHVESITESQANTRHANNLLLWYADNGGTPW